MLSLAKKIFNHQLDRPAAALVFLFALGIVLSQTCSDYSFIGLVSGNFLLIAASFLALKRDRFILSLYLGFAAILISGLLLAFAQRDSFSDTDLRALLSHHAFPLNEPVSFQGCVIKDSEVRETDVLTTIEMRAFLQKDQWIVCKGKGILRIAKPAPEYAAGRTLELRRGDRISGWATWRVPRNYENPGSADRAGLLARRGIFLVGRIKSTRLMEIIPGECGNCWTKLATSVAGRVRKKPGAYQRKRKGAAGGSSCKSGHWRLFGAQQHNPRDFPEYGDISCPGCLRPARGLDCGSSSSVLQVDPLAGEDSLPAGCLGDSFIHLCRRIPGKHHPLSLDVPALSDRPNDLSPGRSRKRSSGLRPYSVEHTTELAVRDRISAFILVYPGNFADGRSANPQLLETSLGSLEALWKIEAPVFANGPLAPARAQPALEV